MKSLGLMMGLILLACGCGYSHIASTITTFNQLTPLLASGSNDAQGGPLVLKITRHLDTVMSGPDAEEDQLLKLELKSFRLNQKIPVPSENVNPRFIVNRSGPRSEGKTFDGYLIVRKAGADEVSVYLHIDVAASTADGSYVQTAKFRGEHKFFRETTND